MAENRGLSYSHTPQGFSNIYDTFPSRLRSLATKQPDKPALIVYSAEGERNSLTFSQLVHKSEKFAKQLVNMGVKKGDFVAIFVYNSIEWAIAEFGTMFAGAVPMNSFSFPGDPTFNAVRSVGCTALIVDIRKSSASGSLLKNSEDLHSGSQGKGILKTVIYINDNAQDETRPKLGKDFHSLLTDSSSLSNVKLPNVSPEDPCVLFPTSGSTGVPKLVLSQHSSYLTFLTGLSRASDIRPDDIFFVDRPFGYVGGFPGLMVTDGIPYVSVDTRVSVAQRRTGLIVDIFQKEGVTYSLLLPYIIKDIDQLKSKGVKVSKLRCSYVTGQRLSKSILDEFKEFVHEPLCAYGITECFSPAMVTLSRLSGDLEGIGGYNLPGVEIKIVDDVGGTLPLLELGEICIRGYGIGKAYIVPDGTRKPMKDLDGWFHTEDVGFMAEDGLLFLRGRKVEMIKRAGMKIFPASIEMVLRKHPDVAEVTVVGVPDPRFFQEICACVVIKYGHSLTAAVLESYALEQFEPTSKPDGLGLMPKYFLIFNEFPRLPTQKVNRTAVVSQAVKLLKL